MRAVVVSASRAEPRARFGLAELAATMTFVAIAFIALLPATDADFGWHVANGRHLLDGTLLGGHDVYSWTAAGAPWIAHEWLTDAAMAFLNDAFGPTALSLAAAAVIVAAFAFVAIRVRMRGHGLVVVAATTLLAALASVVSLGVRPQMLELLYLAVALYATDRWLAGTLSTRTLSVLVVAGTLLWANSHGSFLLVPAVLGADCLALAFRRDRRAIPAAALGLVALAVPLLNPWGPALYGFAAQSLGSGTAQRLIEEWQPPALAQPSYLPFVLELLMLAGGGLAALRVLARARAEGRVRAPDAADIAAVALTGLLVVLALRSGRFVMLVGISAAPLLAWTIARLAGLLANMSAARRQGGTPRVANRGERSDADDRGRTIVNVGVVVAFALVLAVVVWSRVGPAGQAEATASTYPAGLLPALDRVAATDGQLGTPLRLLNAWEYGGFLLMNRPDVKVFIDGRSEVYGDAQVLRYGELIGLVPGWERQLAGLGVNAVLMPRSSALPVALEKLGWQVAGEDVAGVLLVPPDGA